MNVDGPQQLEHLRAQVIADGLDLPDARLRSLLQRLAEFHDEFDEVWNLDLGNLDPPVLTYSDDGPDE